MGGGGYPVFNISGGLKELERIGREQIRRSIERPPRRRVFLSFRGEDKNLVDEFRKRAKDQKSPLDFIDFSLVVPFRSENAEYIRRGIRERIKNCSVTIVLVGETTYQSEWVDWEIRESEKLGKGIVAVKLVDPVVKPKALEDLGIELLPMDDKIISRAIQEAAEKRRDNT
ncbi:MAG: TIR domain-containing protein [Candidatus Marinimicrobia bacterium]|nr:TIR domain-containing protein [Candidatus Neomarinimicrobiota bacterium]